MESSRERDQSEEWREERGEEEGERKRREERGSGASWGSPPSRERDQAMTNTVPDFGRRSNERNKRYEGGTKTKRQRGTKTKTVQVQRQRDKEVQRQRQCRYKDKETKRYKDKDSASDGLEEGDTFFPKKKVPTLLPTT